MLLTLFWSAVPIGLFMQTLYILHFKTLQEIIFKADTKGREHYLF